MFVTFVWGGGCVSVLVLERAPWNSKLPHSLIASGPGKVPWNVTDVRHMALDIKTKLPVAVAQVLGSDQWAGGALVQLDDTISTPKSEDMILNHCWMLPVVKKFRDRVPSQFFLADVMVYMDKLFFQKLLVPVQEGDSKLSLATNEAKKIKMLIGGLRTLWRSSVLIQLLQRLLNFYMLCQRCSILLFFIFPPFLSFPCASSPRFNWPSLTVLR